MQILPVIDLLGGAVVRGIAGERHAYRPIQSAIAHSASPGEIARALVDTFRFEHVYVADLDAIAQRQPAWNDYAAIAAAGLQLWVDAGVSDLASATAIARQAARVIVGLESLRSPHELAKFPQHIPPEQLVFSLDLKHGRPITTIDKWASASPLAIAEAACDAGFRQMIILDLAHVGMGQGSGTSELCHALRSRWPKLELTSGGGVACAEDLKRLADDGLDYALVASALHDARLQPAEIARWHV